MKYKVLLIITFLLAFYSTIWSQNYVIRKKIQSLTGKVSTLRLKTDIDKLVGFYNRNTFSDTVSENKGIGAARRWLYSEFVKINNASGGRMKVYYDNFYKKLSERFKNVANEDSIKLANVIAVIPGTSSERVLIINGHYDSRTYSGTDTESFAPGANDDGSGTIALLELARILSRERFKNTIMLAALIAEEQGLWGAAHLAEQAKNTKMKVEGVIANDMIGNITGGDGKSDNTILRCFSPDPIDSPSRNFALYVNKISDEYFPLLKLKMIFRLDRFGRGGDHLPFIRQGFAGIRLTEPYENYKIQHSPDDTPDNISFEYFTRTTQLNLTVASYWANSPEPPEIVSITRDPDYKTILKFTCPEPQINLQGFQVYIRETDSEYWTESIFFPTLKAIIENTKGKVYNIALQNRDRDYYIFGLASVNKEGYESIASTYNADR